MEFLKQVGCDAEMVRLRDYGIVGNGNLMLMEKNNHEVFGVVRDWLDRKVAPPRGEYNPPMASRNGLGLWMLLAAMLPPLSAQWLKLPDKGIPRTKDGKPNLTAPAPHKADGKPDLSGVWIVPGPKYLQNLAADLKPEDVPMQPWAAALTKDRMSGGHAAEESDANCLPQGVPKINVTPVPFKIVQNPGRSDHPVRGFWIVPASLYGWARTAERSESFLDGLLDR